MSFTGNNLLNLLVALVILVIFLVIILWLVDRFLIATGGIYLYDNTILLKDQIPFSFKQT